MWNNPFVRYLTDPVFGTTEGLTVRRDVRRKGFTLIEIMIVVLIIAILLAIAIPNFMRARLVSQEKACISNLDKIEGGKEQFIMEHNKGVGDVVAFGDLVPAYIKAMPECPSSGKYAVEAVNAMPTCSVAGHVYHQ